MISFEIKFKAAKLAKFNQARHGFAPTKPDQSSKTPEVKLL